MNCSDCHNAPVHVDGRCRDCDRAEVLRAAMADRRRQTHVLLPLSRRKWDGMRS